MYFLKRILYISASSNNLYLTPHEVTKPILKSYDLKARFTKSKFVNNNGKYLFQVEVHVWCSFEWDCLSYLWVMEFIVFILFNSEKEFSPLQVVTMSDMYFLTWKSCTMWKINFKQFSKLQILHQHFLSDLLGMIQ